MLLESPHNASSLIKMATKFGRWRSYRLPPQRKWLRQLPKADAQTESPQFVFHRSSAHWAEGRRRRPMPSAPDRSPPRGSYRRRVAPPRDRKGSEYANFDCQERVNAGQKVVQLGHPTGTNIIPRVSPAAGRYHPGAASRYAVMVRAMADHKFKIR